MLLVNCATCKRQVKIYPKRLRASKSGLIFCGRGCKEIAQSLKGNVVAIQPPHYGTGTGIYSYRAWAFQAYGKICAVCGYSEDERMLDVDHIDEDRSNNKIENLQVLCVWHHALKTRVGT